MKTLRLLLLAVGLMAAPATFAQLKGFGIGPYAEVAFPTGEYDNVLKTGFGGGIALDIKLPLNLGVTGSAGVLHFPVKETGSSLTAFPVRAGLKYRISMFYIGVESGVAPLTKSDGAAPVLLSPAIGVRLLKFDIRAKYETWFRDANNNNENDMNFFGLQASVKF